MWRPRAESTLKGHRQGADRLCYRESNATISVQGTDTSGMHKAKLKPLYSQYRLENSAKVIKITQPVLHD